MTNIIDYATGKSLFRVLKALKPILGETRTDILVQHCEKIFQLHPTELRHPADYAAAPTGTLASRWVWGDCMIKLANGHWREMSTTKSPEYSDAALAAAGPYFVCGWGQTWV